MRPTTIPDDEKWDREAETQGRLEYMYHSSEKDQETRLLTEYLNIEPAHMWTYIRLRGYHKPMELLRLRAYISRLSGSIIRCVQTSKSRLSRMKTLVWA